MSWLKSKYDRFVEIQRHQAGETCTVRAGNNQTRRIYLSDWIVLSRFELRRQERHPDHSVGWMSAEEILAYCDPYDVISFDVFDTLLCRNAGRPEHVFVMLEKQNGILDFADARQAMEREARKEKNEVTLREIYAAMERSGYVVDGEAAMQAEWEMEKRLTAPHPMMLQVVRALAEKGKRVIAVSDMYLSSAQIAELLKIAGYPALEQIFVSCEMGAGKAGGAIYRMVREQIGAERVLHIGDNEEADGKCPVSVGWDTGLLMNPAKLPWEYFSVTPYGGDMIASSLRWQYRYDGGNLIRRGRNGLKQKAEAGAAGTEPAPGRQEGGNGIEDRDAEAYDIGYLVAGPLTVGFCQWIRRLSAERGWEKLFFSARDGYIMHQIYTKFFGEAEYLPVSRAAVQMLDMEKQALGYCENNLPAHLGTGETVGHVLEGLMLQEMIPTWQKDGLDTGAAFDEKAAEQIQGLILRDRRNIAELFRPARDSAARWLREQLVGVSRAAVIDTGWKGSAGATLQDFLRENGMPVTIETALMGTSRSPSVAVREERGELFSWLFSPSHDLDRLKKQYEGGKSLACTLFEMLFMTNLPQLLSYAGEGFTYGQTDERFLDLPEALQAGTMDFARDYAEAAARSGVEPEIPAAAAWRYFEELLAEKERILRAFGSYVHHMAPTPETVEITFRERMRMNGWIK